MDTIAPTVTSSGGEAFPSNASEQLQFVLQYAVRAPSGHNNQPWRFRIVEDRLELYADRSRTLPVVDPEDRALLIGCGAALSQLVVALRRFGFAGDVAVLPDPADRDLLATIRRGPRRTPRRADHELFDAIGNRRTHRFPFEPRPVPDAVLTQLRHDAEQAGAGLHVVVQGDAKQQIAVLVGRGDRQQLADRRFRTELASWIRSNYTRKPDGIPGYAFGMPGLASLLGPLFIRTANIGKRQAAKDEQLTRTAPALLLLTAAEDTPSSWLAAGQAVGIVLLRATAAGLADNRTVVMTAPRSYRIGRAVTAAATAALLLVSLPATATTAPSTGGGSAPQTATGLTEVARVLREQLDASGIPGGAVAVVSEGRVETRGVGTDGDSHDITATTPFVIGSASKSFTALAVMQLVDSGDVNLDAPVRQYVPDLELGPGEPVDDITVRHLLQQTSGLDDLSGGALLASAGDGSPEQAIAELGDAELVSTPGETWRYANANFVLAGLVVERASGIPYADFVERRIFRPLGMNHSYADSDAAEGDGLTRGHRFWFGLPVATEPTGLDATLAAGYLVSSAEDLGRYLSMYLADGTAPDGTRIVSSRALDTMLGSGPEARLGPWSQGQRSHYAMGWFRGGPWAGDAVFHPGNTPDTSTMLSFFPSRGVAVATLLNAGHELPVPGNPSVTDRVARNVIHAALGQPVLRLPSLRGFYVRFDIVVLVLVAAAGWSLARAAGALRRRTPRRGVRHPAAGWWGVGIRSVTASGLAVLPLLSYGWAGVWTWAPDLALTLAALALVLATTAALRVVGLVRVRHHRKLAEPTERSAVHVPA
jgi:CubicO group peptidase (beta-lactamase class C family)/nitroreductase